MLTSEFTQSLVAGYLADRINVNEMCNRLDVELNRCENDRTGACFGEALRTELNEPYSIERCLSLQTGGGEPPTEIETGKFLFHPSWSEACR